ncbi:MAG TPA: N-acetylmuramoyl-L-alanine amidase [Anaerolineaceae bacterium]|nr:N-acetylmuramoyl-L-alanine amidase [Anaerolineaceae bacterium]HPN53784.1 N-acetylmuramoyl-L-alanine amidase [Anaerolineaceae bacterium]
MNSSDFTPIPSNQPKISAWRAIQTMISVAILVATLFTIWTPKSLFNSNLEEQMALMVRSSSTATPVPEPVAAVTATAQALPRIGIIAGHWGVEDDPGAVCTDIFNAEGNPLTEREVNLRIATYVTQKLMELGYSVDLLQEFDNRLLGYRANVLVSVHNDSCVYINDEATGYKVSPGYTSADTSSPNRLADCLTNRYGTATNLPFHRNSITRDMTDYHAFKEMNTNTVGAIIETGFLNRDHQFLIDHADQAAQGIVDGILCYIRNEPIEEPQPMIKATTAP